MRKTKGNAELFARSNRRSIDLGIGALAESEILLEMVRLDDGLGLLMRNGKRIEIMEEVRYGDTTYYPARLDPSIAAAMRFPKDAVPFGTTRELFDAISRLLVELAGVSERDANTLAFFVFATWFSERLSLPPLLWVIAPPTSAGTNLLQLLQLLCRRSFRVVDFSLSTLRRLPMSVGPTVFMEPRKATAAFLRTVHATARLGSNVFCDGGLIDLGCARVICTATPAEEAVPGSPLEIALAPAREYIAPLPPNEAERISDDFQAKLLMYRMANYARLAPAAIDVANLTLPTQNLAHDLALCIVDDNELQKKIVSLLTPRDLDIRVERGALLEGIVVEALLAGAHDFGRDEIPVLELTTMVNTIVQGRGESKEHSPEEIGWKLRGLGVPREYLSGGRKGVALDDRAREHIHGLAFAYGIRSLLQAPASPPCPFCVPPESEGSEGDEDELPADET